MAIPLTINLIWVPGHCIIEGHCIADKLARQGTTADILRDKDTVGMPMATCKLHLRQRLYTLSNNRWNLISTCHNYRLTWPNYNSKRRKPLLQRSREDISTLSEEESIEHLLCFCRAHYLKHFQILGSYTLPNLAAIQGVSIQNILCFLRRTKYFAKANNP